MSYYVAFPGSGGSNAKSIYPQIGSNPEFIPNPHKLLDDIRDLLSFERNPKSNATPSAQQFDSTLSSLSEETYSKENYPDDQTDIAPSIMNIGVIKQIISVLKFMKLTIIGYSTAESKFLTDQTNSWGRSRKEPELPPLPGYWKNLYNMHAMAFKTKDVKKSIISGSSSKESTVYSPHSIFSQKVQEIVDYKVNAVLSLKSTSFEVRRVIVAVSAVFLILGGLCSLTPLINLSIVVLVPTLSSMLIQSLYYETILSCKKFLMNFAEKDLIRDLKVEYLTRK